MNVTDVIALLGFALMITGGVAEAYTPQTQPPNHSPRYLAALGTIALGGLLCLSSFIVALAT
jgi:hypothetical protein